MPAKNKRRGNTLEREFVEAAKAAGLEAQRAWGSNGKALGESEDVDCLIGGERMQCKRRKSLASYLQIPASCDVVGFRQDRGERLVLMRESHYLTLLNNAKGKQ